MKIGAGTAKSSLADTIKAHSIPVEKHLGKQTHWVLVSPEQIDSYLVQAINRKKPITKFDDYTILVQGPQLSNEQIDFLQSLVFNPESYYNGVPTFRRFPHIPGFALRCQRENETLDIMIDLHNPGWDFYCGIERYSSWNWVGDELVSLAKSLFPEFASPHRRSVWKKGVIKSLVKKAG